MLDVAFEHRARQLVPPAASADRDFLGSRQTAGDPVPGPWIEARLTERAGPAPRQRRGDSEAVRVDRRYEVLLDIVDVAGGVVAVPVAGAVFEFDAEVLGSPTVVLVTRPEVLNDGVDVFGYFAFADVVSDGT